METLNEFITRRKAEITEEIARLRAELRQINAAESMGQAEMQAQKSRAAQHTPETIKEQVVKILIDHPKGLNAKELQSRLKRRFGRDVKRESLSPQLSRLGRDGVIKRDGKTWILPLVESALTELESNVRARSSLGNGALATENPQEIHS